jgi:Protein of unknown function (DUF1488)
MLFDILVGDARVACAISRGALQHLSERRSFRTEDLQKSFMKARGRIEQIAHEKLRARPDRISGTLLIWADDLDDLPPSSAPDAVHASVGASRLHTAWKENAMAKGQKRSNREQKKPKTAKIPISTPASILTPRDIAKPLTPKGRAR